LGVDLNSGTSGAAGLGEDLGIVSALGVHLYIHRFSAAA
jgi:hypothetical protein